MTSRATTCAVGVLRSPVEENGRWVSQERQIQ